MTANLCTASWPGGSCDRPAEISDLCRAHYAQQRRGKTFAPLKGAHGADLREMVPVLIRIPADDADVIRAEAEARGGDIIEVYREAVAAFASELRKRANRQQTVDA
ncbi:hypothetical protein QEG98_27980 [Myxococcus sp. MxC21-1]|uniref:hypothetical protein n=1 Tax=Myxococcus sp. MxC21-1 TaxID=3041439 RepID=UPI00292F37B1|nr:hypothetical protein [Myxococcus sp. MxC21-1]WNZ59844.1 hypothetical protein QEG98_27980 [Myxococcus sp. MxC21-1]